LTRTRLVAIATTPLFAIVLGVLMIVARLLGDRQDASFRGWRRSVREWADGTWRIEEA
jgi:hypothetical protein